MTFWKQSFREKGNWFESLSKELNHEAETKKETPGRCIHPPKCEQDKKYVLSVFYELRVTRHCLVKKTGEKIPSCGGGGKEGRENGEGGQWGREMYASFLRAQAIWD